MPEYNSPSRHPLYKIWFAIVSRCTKSTDQAFYNYGGRGIMVCEEWINSYGSFYNWAISAGWQKGMQVDKDTKGDGLLYSPQTCAIITRLENNRRRRGLKLTLEKANEIRSSKLHPTELAKIYNVDKSTINGVINHKIWGTETPIEGLSKRDIAIKARSTKITQIDVADIRESKETNITLAKRYGLCASHISEIKNYKVWK